MGYYLFEERTSSSKSFNVGTIAVTMLLGFLFFVGASFAYTPDDFFVNIVDSHADLTSAYFIFEVKNPTLFSATISPSSFGSMIRKGAEYTDEYSVTWYLGEDKVISEDERFCSYVKVGSLPNGTDDFGYNCSTVSKSYPTTIWNELKSFSFDSGEKYKLKVEVKYPPKLGLNSRDFIPLITFDGKVYSQDKWLWFNVSYASKRPLNVPSFASNFVRNVIIPVRDNTSVLIPSRMRGDCFDYVVVNGSENVAQQQFLEDATCNKTRTWWWVKTDLQPDTNTTHYSYYNFSLASNQSSIQALNGSTINTSAYLFDEGQGTIVADKFGRATLTATNSPKWVNTSIGYGLNFTNNNDYLEVTPPAAFPTISGGNTSIWVLFKANSLSTFRLIDRNAGLGDTQMTIIYQDASGQGQTGNRLECFFWNTGGSLIHSVPSFDLVVNSTYLFGCEVNGSHVSVYQINGTVGGGITSFHKNSTAATTGLRDSTGSMRIAADRQTPTDANFDGLIDFLFFYGEAKGEDYARALAGAVFGGNTFGAEENQSGTSPPPVVNIISPANITYYGNTSIYLNFNSTDDNITINLTAYLDNSLVYSNATYQNNTNVTFLQSVTAGHHNFTVIAKDFHNQTTVSSVFFTIFHGLNLSAFLFNGTAISGWSLNASNATISVLHTGLNNPSLFEYNRLNVSGTVNLNVTATGYDNHTRFSIPVNSTMGFVQLNFTLYPFSYFYLRDSSIDVLLSDWLLTAYNGTVYLSKSTSGTLITVSGRELFNGTNTFNGTKAAYDTVAHTTSIDVSRSYNITLNTTTAYFVINVFDEVTPGKQLGFNVNLVLVGTNVTTYSMTGFRTGKTCFYDRDESTSCISVSSSSTTAVTYNDSTVQGFDYSNATFRVIWKNDNACGTCQGVVQVKVGTDIWYSATVTASAALQNATFNIDNRFGNYSRAANMTVHLQSTGGSGPDTNVLTLYEVRQLSNSVGYIYSGGVTNNSIAFPVSIIPNYTTYNAFVRGEETYEPLYTAQRMYRISLSQFATYSLNAYLLKDLLGFFQQFRVLDFNNQAIQGALVTISRWYGGVATVIAQCESNPAGDCSIFLSPTTTYAFRAEKSGYQTRSESAVIFNGAAQPALIYLTPGTSSNFTIPLQGITVALSPTNKYNFVSKLNATCQVLSTEGNINYINWTGYYFNVTNSTINTGNFTRYKNLSTSSAPSGTTLLIEVNDTGRFKFECAYQFFSNASGQLLTYTTSNAIEFFVQSDSLFGAGEGQLDKATGTWIVAALILFISIFLMFKSVPGTVLVDSIILVGAAWIGLVDWWIAALTVIVALIILWLDKPM